MSRELDTTADFATVVDHLQTVTLLRPGSSFSLEIVGAFRASLSSSTERSKLGKYQQHDVTWLLPTNAGDFTPDLGDQIIDAEGNRWTVLAFRRTMDGARWRIVARNMLVAHRLNEFIDIDQAIFEKDERGIEIPVWRPWKTGLPARIEIEAVDINREKEPLGTTHSLVIHLSEPILLAHTHRIRHPDGRTFSILRCRSQQEYGATFQIEIEETPQDKNS